MDSVTKTAIHNLTALACFKEEEVQTVRLRYKDRRSGGMALKRYRKEDPFQNIHKF